jgi:hypothetical protein
MLHEYGRSAAARSGALDFAEVAASWARITGEDISGGTPVWVDAFGDGSRQAGRYRMGRLLLAGDSAHLQMPVGGQALNLGLQDAVNLGWKLAADVRGWAPATLLDTYHLERHPVGSRVQATVRAQSMLLLGGNETDAMRTVLGELLGLGSARGHLAELLSGIDVRYDVGAAGHPLLGMRLPHLDLVTASGRCGTSAQLHRARGFLLSLSNSPATRRLRGAVSAWSSRVDLVEARAAEPALVPETGAVLVRPDGHVAWVDGGGEDLPAALRRWFGAPAVNRTPVAQEGQ